MLKTSAFRPGRESPPQATSFPTRQVGRPALVRFACGSDPVELDLVQLPVKLGAQVGTLGSQESRLQLYDLEEVRDPTLRQGLVQVLKTGVHHRRGVAIALYERRLLSLGCSGSENQIVSSRLSA